MGFLLLQNLPCDGIQTEGSEGVFVLAGCRLSVDVDSPSDVDYVFLDIFPFKPQKARLGAIQ